VPRVLIAAVAGLAVGLLFITANVTALHDPQPHAVPVVSAGIAPQRVQAELDRAVPSGYVVEGVRDVGAAELRIVRREAYGAVVDEGGRAEVLTASADGVNAATVIQEALMQVAGPAGIAPAPTTRDVVPLQDGDPRGASLQPIVLGTIMAGFFMGMVSAQLALSEPFSGRLLTTAAFAVIFGGLAATILDPLVGVLTDHFGWLWLWLTVAAFAIAETVRALGRGLGMPGLGLAIVVVLVLGNASAAVSAPPQFLPGLFSTIGPWLPPGAAADGLLGTTYFDADVSRAAVVLGAWSLVAILVLSVADRWRGRRPGLALDAARAAAPLRR
jgi:hypothetical protein